MRILMVIHGYPMRYNAGSEIYTQTLATALVAWHDVRVFTREENPFAPDYSMREDSDDADARVRLHLVNLPRSRDRYRHPEVDRRFADVLDAFKPDVVHVGHLNHLSTSLLTEAARREIPIVYTLHDFWVMCPRGQFMQTHPENPEEIWASCDGQEDRKCAERCYARYFSGAPHESIEDIRYWSEWVRRRMSHVREMAGLVDLFIAPSRYLLNRYRDEFGIPAGRLRYLDYGFDRARLQGRRRVPGESFTFGYIGTHIPAKGVHQLLDAFGRIQGRAQLRIWGRPRGQETESLRQIATQLPNSSSVSWLHEYRNENIVNEVFNRVDAIVVPSVWVENSPLVIHEALGAGVPVVTADVGGMVEYVGHELNGLVFRHRDPQSMAAQMQRLVDEPALAIRLGARGYLQSESGEIPDIQDHVREVERIYESVRIRHDSARLEARPGPWRITLDTNPDTCNLRCIMCEEHSPLSTNQAERRAAGLPRRIMPVELVERVLRQAAASGLREVIPSTMGEPLLYEHFDRIVDLCCELSLRLNLTTNGTFPRRGARSWAERIVPVGSDVKISWNGSTGPTHESIMLGARWHAVLENVRDFVAVRDHHARTGGNRCRVTFQLTFLESNVGELADIVRLAARLGVDRVKGHHLWAHFDGLKPLSMRRSPEAIRRWNDAVTAATAAADEVRLPGGQPVLLENLFPLDPEGGASDIAPGGGLSVSGARGMGQRRGTVQPMLRAGPATAEPRRFRKPAGSRPHVHLAR